MRQHILHDRGDEDSGLQAQCEHIAQWSSCPAPGELQKMMQLCPIVADRSVRQSVHVVTTPAIRNNLSRRKRKDHASTSTPCSAAAQCCLLAMCRFTASVRGDCCQFAFIRNRSAYR